eukprot:TRINITY_DN3410_c0_g2_i4.p1 TRINITY_DN3410_c0_g2~~TRINITY_DN3410_c0_g2_i4.p1  ORF type:complete len:672 (+),score=113.87 TRINITY_DN3410_c0_g2_i4:113-2017(+)
MRNELQNPDAREKIKAMQMILAYYTAGLDVRTLFPEVVKNLSDPSIELKRYVHTFLIHASKVDPGTALLAVNILHKELSSESPLVRGSALRTLASMQVPEISQVVLISLKSCIHDQSPYVRKTAALCIRPVYALDPDIKDELVECLDVLLRDDELQVVGAAIVSHLSLCPDRLSMYEYRFHQLCKHIDELDEWLLPSVINALTRFARVKNKAPYQNPSVAHTNQSNGQDSFLLDDSVDSMLEMLVNAASGLLHHTNTAVVMSAACLIYHIGSFDRLYEVGKPLIFRLKLETAQSFTILQHILLISRNRPDVFRPFVQDLFPSFRETKVIFDLKWQVLVNLVNETNISKYISHFKIYLLCYDPDVTALALPYLADCILRVPEQASVGMQIIIRYLNHSEENVTTAAMLALRKVISPEIPPTANVMKRLSRHVIELNHTQSRSSAAWILGEYLHITPEIIPDTVRQLLLKIHDQPVEMKTQILNLAVKACLAGIQQGDLMAKYAIDVCLYDADVDLRDRARFHKKIFYEHRNPRVHDQITTIIQSKKPSHSSISDEKSFDLGTLSFVTQKRQKGYVAVPPFGELSKTVNRRNSIKDFKTSRQVLRDQIGISFVRESLCIILLLMIIIFSQNPEKAP